LNMSPQRNESSGGRQENHRIGVKKNGRATEALPCNLIPTTPDYGVLKM
jgi:hypothetical protein